MNNSLPATRYAHLSARAESDIQRLRAASTGGNIHECGNHISKIVVQLELVERSCSDGSEMVRIKLDKLEDMLVRAESYMTDIARAL